LNFVTFCATGVNRNPGIAGAFALHFNSKSYGFLLSLSFQQAGQHPEQGCPACSDFIRACSFQAAYDIPAIVKQATRITHKFQYKQAGR